MRNILGVLALFVVLPLVFPAILAAKVEGYPEPAPDLSFYLSGTPVYRFPAKVDGGGTLSVFSIASHADVSKQVNEKLGAGLGLFYELDDYNFSGLTGFPVPRPWNSVQRLGFSVPLFYSLNDTWKLILIPLGEFSGELGAKFSDALVYGGAMAVTHTFGPRLSLGLGLTGYYNLAQARLFPILIVNWQIGEKFRLTNPFRTGLAGPAGLELIYNLHQHWEVSIGGAYRSYRFRLDNNGPIPNGIGEYDSIPIFARLSYKPSPAFELGVYGGASFLNKIYIDDHDGNELYRTKSSVSPLVGLSFSGRF